MSEVNEKTPLLEVRNLRKLFAGKSSFFQKDKSWIKAVDDVSFTLNPKETLGVVGESGCGKSTMGRSVLRLIEPTSGEIFYKGKDFAKASGQELRKMRADMQIIFQDPYASLNPRMTIGEIIAEPLNIQKRYKTQEETRAQVLKVMEVVGLNTKYYNRYPHEFSGGQRQRIVIARALVLNPEFVVCDEPVSALDVSVRAQVLNLIQELKKKKHLTYMFISHDLSVVKYISDRIAVMYLGRIVEITEKNEDYKAFCEALNYINETLAKKMAGDGEGCTALFEVKIKGAQTKEQAKILAKSVITSSLTKAAIFGHDANWGRILCAMGYSGAEFDPEQVDLYFESAAGSMQIIKDGVAVDYSEEQATKILSEPEVTAIADIKMGTEEAAAWGCDLTFDYVKINADYRS